MKNQGNMFNLYQNMNKNDRASKMGSSTTGHDRFCQERPRGRRTRRKRNISRRVKSSPDLNSPSLASANKLANKRSFRTGSSEEEEDDGILSTPNGEKTPLLSNRLESLSRLFTCVSMTPNSPERRRLSINTDRQRHGGRYEYTALEADNGVHERMEMERKSRERAQNACHHYLRACPRYALIHQLNDIGSRVDKHWFIVRDTSVKTERLLTLVPRSPSCPIECEPSTRDTILSLFLALQHPYIYPVLDMEFSDVEGQMYIVLVLPFNNKGSLKDLIYKSKWQEDWSQKYGQRSAGLPISQVQRLGRQILEALLFLKERGFPPYSHLHSGNVILQNGVARLTGLENTLLGYNSRIHPMIWSKSRVDPQSTDAICFGHVLFEMCAGYELCSPNPMPDHMVDIKGYPQIIEILEFIFHHPEDRYPTVEELLLCDFFRNIDLREMRAAPLPLAFQARLTASTISLLNQIKQHQMGRRLRRTQSQASSSIESSSPTLRERSCRSVGELENEVWNLDTQPVPENTYVITQIPDSPTQEHRDLSLNLQDDCVFSDDTSCLLR